MDVELVVEFDKKLQFIDLCRGITHAGHVPYEDFVYSSKYLEGALLSFLRRKNLVAPNKPADRQEKMQAIRDNNEEKFIGAYVKSPIVGKYDWVYDLDLTSLYPSIIMTLNISPESKIGKIRDWIRPDSMCFIDDLIEYATQPKFKYVHKWSQNDLIIWDNRQTMHRARAFDDLKERRDMRRTTVLGEEKLL